MKALAVIHWQDNGNEQSLKCYTQEEINFLTARFQTIKQAYAIFFCDLDVIIPITRTRKARTAV